MSQIQRLQQHGACSCKREEGTGSGRQRAPAADRAHLHAAVGLVVRENLRHVALKHAEAVHALKLVVALAVGLGPRRKGTGGVGLSGRRGAGGESASIGQRRAHALLRAHARVARRSAGTRPGTACTAGRRVHSRAPRASGAWGRHTGAWGCWRGPGTSAEAAGDCSRRTRAPYSPVPAPGGFQVHWLQQGRHRTAAGPLRAPRRAALRWLEQLRALWGLK